MKIEPTVKVETKKRGKSFLVKFSITIAVPVVIYGCYLPARLFFGK